MQKNSTEDISPELMRYLDRDYWEKKEKEKAEQKAKALSGAYINTTAPPQSTTTAPLKTSDPVVKTEAVAGRYLFSTYVNWGMVKNSLPNRHTLDT